MRIFISPLDWGLGHAARCVPIIRYLVEKKIEIIIGAEGQQLIFLKEHFPDIEFIEFPGYRVSYSKMLPAGIKVLQQLPKIKSAINKEHELLAIIIKNKKIDALISDNRYGLWNEKVPSIIITHQLNIQAPIGKSFFSNIVRKYVNHFDECWIPDYEEKKNLSGILSHPIPKGIRGKYISPLSRFEPLAPSNPKNKKYDLLVLLSGPEAQRSKLEKIVLKQLKELPSTRVLLVQGLPGNKPTEGRLNKIDTVPHLSDEELQDAINSSDVILSRPGYSTIMDLTTIGLKKTIFIPTPGQTEQEYLGNLMQEKGWAITYNQKRFSLKNALEKAKQLKPLQPNFCKENYKEVIDVWLKKIS